MRGNGGYWAGVGGRLRREFFSSCLMFWLPQCEHVWAPYAKASVVYQEKIVSAARKITSDRNILWKGIVGLSYQQAAGSHIPRLTVPERLAPSASSPLPLPQKVVCAENLWAVGYPHPVSVSDAV